jgi:hypothetical protein
MCCYSVMRHGSELRPVKAIIPSLAIRACLSDVAARGDVNADIEDS